MMKRRQGWMLELEGACEARVSAARRVECGMGRGRKQREVCRERTAEERSMVVSGEGLGRGLVKVSWVVVGEVVVWVVWVVVLMVGEVIQNNFRMTSNVGNNVNGG